MVARVITTMTTISLTQCRLRYGAPCTSPWASHLVTWGCSSSSWIYRLVIGIVQYIHLHLLGLSHHLCPLTPGLQPQVVIFSFLFSSHKYKIIEKNMTDETYPQKVHLNFQGEDIPADMCSD